MDTSLAVTRRRVIFRQKRQQEDVKLRRLSTSAQRVEENQPQRFASLQCCPSASSTSSESSSSTQTSQILYRGDYSHCSHQEQEESNLDTLSTKLTLDEEKPVKFIEAVAKGLKRPQENIEWKTSYISIPNSVTSPKKVVAASNQKRARDFDYYRSNSLSPGNFLTLIRRKCYEHSRIKMKKPKSSSCRESFLDPKENNCERCQMMTSWMVAIRQAIVAASALPFDPRYHYVSYSVDKRGVIYCNEPLIRFLPIRNSAEQAPRKRARTEGKSGSC